MRENGRGYPITGLISFSLVALFVALSMVLAAVGARGYRRGVAAAENNAQVRATLAYVTNKLHAFDDAGAASIEENSGVTALALTQEIEGETYRTRIYLFDGSLMEQFTPSGAEFDPAMGTELARANEFEVKFEAPNLIALRVRAPGGADYVSSVALRSGGDAP